MHYIYITTNKLNGMAYIGQRKLPTNKTIETDNYLGSGTRLLYAIKKHGKENFTKEILHTCITPKLADKLEIKEIEKRGALLDKTKFYNISAGGQYGRAENHSEITSESMKSYYTNENNYTNQILKKNRDRYKKGLRPTKNIFLYQKDIDKLIKQLRLEIKQNSLKEKRLIKKLIKESNKDKYAHSKAGKEAWNKSDEEIKKRIKKATTNRKNNCIKENKPFHSTECISKFSLAKLKANNNQLGIYLIENGAVSISILRAKIYKVNNNVYKDKTNLINQIKKIVEVSNLKLGVLTDFKTVYDIVIRTRAENGLD